MPRDTDGHGKTDDRRPCQTSREEYDLRHALAFGLITKEQFDTRYNELLMAGRITRSGRVLRHGQAVDSGGDQAPRRIA